jgi:hypothetical protein
MVAVPLGQATYRRRDMRTPEIELTNLLVENDPTNQVDGKVLFQRPGLTQLSTVGTIGPIRGVFRRYGVVNSQYIVVSATKAFTVSDIGGQTELGDVGGSDIVSIDGSDLKAIIVSDGSAYFTTGASLTLIVMPDSQRVSGVVYINGYFILVVENSQKFYWLAPGDTNPDPLNFASVETAPDNIVKAARLLDELWFLGQQTTEVWQLTANLDLPFQPVGGRLYEKGCANRDTAQVLDNTLFWVGNDLIVYRADTTPVRISSHSVEERLANAGLETLKAWAFSIDGHTLYCLTIGSQGTWAFDVENQNWPRFKSYGKETWRAHLGTQVDGSLIVAGDDTSNILYQLDNTVSNDNGAQLERIVTGGLNILGRPQPCRDFSVAMAMGWAPITGDAVNPTVLMRYSDDGGNIWSTWIEARLGLEGQYNGEVVWRQLGLMQSPGRLFTVKVTDDAIVRISYARANEAFSI